MRAASQSIPTAATAGRSSPRIAVVGPSWPFRSGVAQATTDLCATLKTQGAIRAFLAPQEQYPRLLFPGTSDRDESVCRRLDILEACFSLFAPWTWPSVFKRLREVDADIVVVPLWTVAYVPFFFALTRSPKRRYLGIVHNDEEHEKSWWKRPALKALYRSMDGFLCHSHSVESVLRERYPRAKIAYHPMPAHFNSDTPDKAMARRQIGLREGEVAFLFSGLIREYKGLSVLLDAFAKLNAPHARLMVCGEVFGPRSVRRELETKLESLELRGRVLYQLKWLPEFELATWMAASDVVVLPYLSGTTSGVAGRAELLRKPIIGTRVSGIEESVSEGENGLLVSPRDVASLLVALETLCDHNHLNRFTRCAEVRTLPSWSEYAKTVTQLASTL